MGCVRGNASWKNKRLRGPIRSPMLVHQPKLLVVLVAVVLKMASKADSFFDVLVLVSTHASARRY